MKTITIKEHGDVVYYLTSNGFQKGQIKTTRVVSEIREPLSIKYFVNDDISDNFMGHEKSPNEIWDSYEEMLNHFQNNAPK